MFPSKRSEEVSPNRNVAISFQLWSFQWVTVFIISSDDDDRRRIAEGDNVGQKLVLSLVLVLILVVWSEIKRRLKSDPVEM